MNHSKMLERGTWGQQGSSKTSAAPSRISPRNRLEMRDISGDMGTTRAVKTWFTIQLA